MWPREGGERRPHGEGGGAGMVVEGQLGRQGRGRGAGDATAHRPPQERKHNPAGMFVSALLTGGLFLTLGGSAPPGCDAATLTHATGPVKTHF